MTQNVICMSMYMYVVYIYLMSCMNLVYFSQCEQLEGEMVSYLQLQRSQLHRAMDVLHTYATIISQVKWLWYVLKKLFYKLVLSHHRKGFSFLAVIQVCGLSFPVWHKFCRPEQDRVLPNVASGGSMWFYFGKVNWNFKEAGWSTKNTSDLLISN